MFDKVTLKAGQVRLEPLSFEHKAGICATIKDGNLNDLFVTTVPNPENIDSFIQSALDMFDNVEGLAFATIDQSSNKVIGSTRFMCASTLHNKTEIGYTFIAKSFQKSAINTQAKLLMLTHAFEILDLKIPKIAMKSRETLHYKHVSQIYFSEYHHGWRKLYSLR